MSCPNGITAVLAGLAVIGLAGCSTEGARPAAKTSTTPAGSSSATASASATSTTTITETTTVTSTASATTSATQSDRAATSTPMAGGMTNCTREALTAPATQAAQALSPDNVYTVDDLTCSDGWAVTSGLLAGKDNPEMGAPTSFVFEQQGQFWVLKDKAEVCGTDPTSTTAPIDAEIPTSLFLPGCAAG